MSDTEQLARLLSIMRRLRDPAAGCEWDKEQTFATIAQYTIEEAYEVADAIEHGDMMALREELGDLLLQVVFHAQIAEDLGTFDFASVAEAIADKLEARHPHIFGKAAGATSEARWEDLKAAEREVKGASSSMDGVAALPALLRAEKLQMRAARDGFDWPNEEGSLAKLYEEADEFCFAQTEAAKVEEAGDLLFAAVNLLRIHKISAETALKAANKKFERRYRSMEILAEGMFPHLPLDRQEELWLQVKKSEAM